MDPIYVFLIRNDIWIYILCSLGLLWYVSELWRSRRLLRGAMFGLEKERGQRTQRRALLFITLLLAIIGAVTYVNQAVAPTLPIELLKPPTPTPNIFATPLSSPTPLGGVQPGVTPTLAVAATVTLPNQAGPELPEAGGTPESVNGEGDTAATPSFTPAAPLGNCTPSVNISAPPSGATTSGAITFFGTATGDRFGSFDLQANGPETNGEWASMLEEAVRSSLVNGILGTVDLSEWAPGPYTMRLVIIDLDGNEVDQCAIQVTVESESS